MATTDRLSPAPLCTYDARRICLIKPSSLGDVVQSLPILSALRSRFPYARISWVVNSTYSTLLAGVPGLDEVIAFDRDHYRRAGLRRGSEFVGFLHELRRRGFDLTIDLQGLFRSGLMCWATAACKRIGLASAREGANLFYTDIADDLPIERSAVDRYWRVVELFGVGHLSKRFDLGLCPSETAAAQSYLRDLPRPILAINPGTRWETKRWPAERFALTARQWWQRRRTGSVAILGGPGEQSLARTVAEGLYGIPHQDLAARLSLRELAAVLAQCDLLLTNDSGPLHLAAAVGTPTVTLFTCTSPVRAGAYGVGHKVVQTDVECRSSYLKRCEKMDCMRDLTTDRVLPVLELGTCGGTDTVDQRRPA